ncbi:MAG: hypothetical protein B5M48_04765 [Candidatus Omnitrophica bacterium 4484_213]|nr:MAG: hypothetical protein B5M48_04765 [Candidatus Omnitrophica bacterium 4484_213]
MTMDFWRQMDLVSTDDLKTPIVIIGAGGIGSPTCLALAKMGCQRISIFDPDTIENHNLPNQIYRLGDLGKSKVSALKEIIKDFSGLEIEIKEEKYTSQQISGIVICAVDTMEVRQAIWKGVKWNPRIPLYIDARMGAEICRIYSIKPVDPDDVEIYEATLYSDDEAINLPCTARAIIYNVFTIAGLICSQVKKFVRSEKFPKEIIFDLTTLSIVVRW